MPHSKISLLLVDDHAVVRSGLNMILANEKDISIVAEAENGEQAIQAVQQHHPNVTLMDIGLPDMSGIEATAKIKKIFPDTAILALTIHEDEEYFFKMLEAGASGYVPKRAAPKELIAAIRVAAQGEVYIYPSLTKLLVKDYLIQSGNLSTAPKTSLTKRENEVLTYLAEGDTNNQIAVLLHISPKTVGRHRENIMEKLNMHSRTELVKYAIRKGIIKA
ncbi:MAG: response regulator transcription factor [Chloroflexota bacterium]